MVDSKEKKKIDWIKGLVSLCLLLCTISLGTIALRISPIAKWANYQTICVEQESIKAPIEWAVRKCNGRSKVYQVK